ncbi:sialic acid-binding Ig-like lectin 16 [Tupaia chinensis]|uniref:sialic acid-binding Ig-like lectin 16 n=1 Tax=Tupaia chinensis TaxID=246437 RepID=UPI000FFB7723|nr:sialic acid-binding Ig-like lectin 16 [Tupaia chinensis]
MAVPATNLGSRTLPPRDRVVTGPEGFPQLSQGAFVLPGLTNLENSSSLPILEGAILRLVCAADSNPSATLSWVLEDRVLSCSRPSSPGVLELPRVEAGDSGLYTCRAENRLGSWHRSLVLSVLYPPEDLRVMVSQANGTGRSNKEGRASRQWAQVARRVARSNPPASLSWARGNQTLGPSQPGGPGVLELPRIQREHEGGLTCQARNPWGSQQVSLRLQVHYPHPHPNPPAAAGPLLLLGGPGVALQLLLQSLHSPLPALEASHQDCPSGGLLDQTTCLPLQLTPPPGKGRSSTTPPSASTGPREPWDPKATSSTEYSEVKICKC